VEMYIGIIYDLIKALMSFKQWITMDMHIGIIHEVIKTLTSFKQWICIVELFMR